MTEARRYVVEATRKAVAGPSPIDPSMVLLLKSALHTLDETTQTYVHALEDERLEWPEDDS